MSDALPGFPTVRWQRETATFVAAGEPLPDVPEPAALVFPFYGDRLVLADIPGRGWCIPSGRKEPGESAEAAVRREAYEEAGVHLGRVAPLGCFLLTDTDSGALRRAPAFVADVIGLIDLPEGSESRGRMLAAIEDVSALYYAWDPLLAAVFARVWESKERLLPAGVSLSDWIQRSR